MKYNKLLISFYSLALYRISFTHGQYLDELLTTVKLYHYYGPTLSNFTKYTLSKAIEVLEHPLFDVTKKTVLYVHGFTEHQHSESVREIVEAYLTRNDFNILSVDWSFLARDNYIFASTVHLPKVGKALGDELFLMLRSTLNIDKLHLVGHSLGGHLIGEVSRQIHDRSNGTMKLRRLSALDPAFPSFYIIELAKPLSAKDAEFVDVIHTSAWSYGAPFSTGTVDFWPNGGVDYLTNPECVFEFKTCSHRLSYKYWAESVNGESSYKFYSINADSWNSFKSLDLVRDPEIVEMGINCPTNVSGNYYLQTNAEQPFAKGLEGITYQNEKVVVNV